MKFNRILIPFFSLLLLTVSCNDDDNPDLQTDFRDEFVGIYACEKGSTIIELEVSKDPDNEQNLLIGPYSIPIDEDGSFGPANLETETSNFSSVLIELRFNGDEIYYKEQKSIINGLVAPCELTGIKLP